MSWINSTEANQQSTNQRSQFTYKVERGSGSLLANKIKTKNISFKLQSVGELDKFYKL